MGGLTRRQRSLLQRQLSKLRVVWFLCALVSVSSPATGYHSSPYFPPRSDLSEHVAGGTRIGWMDSLSLLQPKTSTVPDLPNRKVTSLSRMTINRKIATPTSLYYGEKRHIDSQLIFDTWEWTANLGSPAALVAGAVLATLVESREFLSPKRKDTSNVRFVKKMCRFMLLSSFGLEIISIFVTTVTGTMLLSHADTAGRLKSLDFNSPLGFLMHNWEFEYLTGRIAFLQGLFNWLGSVALELLIPKDEEGVAAHRMNQFTSSALVTILVAMVSFLNRHMTFYRNYAHMLRRYSVVCVERFFWPPEPLTLFLIPMIMLTSFLGIRAFATRGDAEDN